MKRALLLIAIAVLGVVGWAFLARGSNRNGALEPSRIEQAGPGGNQSLEDPGAGESSAPVAGGRRSEAPRASLEPISAPGGFNDPNAAKPSLDPASEPSTIPVDAPAASVDLEQRYAAIDARGRQATVEALIDALAAHREGLYEDKTRRMTAADVAALEREIAWLKEHPEP